MPLRSNRRLYNFLFTSLVSTLLLLLTAATLNAQSPVPSPAKSTTPSPRALSLAIEPNLGQAPPDARFLARSSRFAVFFTESADATLFLPARTSPAQSRFELFDPLVTQPSSPAAHASLRFSFLNASLAPLAEPLQLLSSTSNYFRGNSASAPLTSIPNYASLAFRELYPGISLSYSGTASSLRTTFTLAPGSDPSTIRLQFSGAQKISLTPLGELLLDLGPLHAPLRISAPIASQPANGSTTPVSASFRLGPGNILTLSVSSFNTALPLEISHISEFDLGLDAALALTLDPSGNIYVTGYTASLNFPTLNPVKSFIPLGDQDIFISKFSPDGSTLLFSTFFGGSGDDVASSIALDSAGNILFGGSTTSPNFPVLNPLQPALLGTHDGFLAKLSPTGSSILFSTYLGGSSIDSIGSFALDDDDFIYLAVGTSSTDMPVVNALQPVHAGAADVFFAKLNPAASQVLFSSFFGGSSADGAGLAIPRDCPRDCDIFLAGTTSSFDLPITPGAIQSARKDTQGQSDGFVARISSNGQNLIYSTYLGSTGNFGDIIVGVAVDSLGFAVVAGRTEGFDFPTTPGAFQTVRGALNCLSAPCFDGFVSRLHPSGTSLEFSTLLGGGVSDWLSDVTLDSAGNPVVVGIADYTSGGPRTPFPTTPGVYQPFNAPPTEDCSGGPCRDAVIAKLNSTGSALIFSTFLGGGGEDGALAVKLDSLGNVLVVGHTTSRNFPTKHPFQSVYGGGPTDAILAKLNPSATDLLYSTYLGGNGDATDLLVSFQPFTAVPRVGDQVTFDLHPLNLGPSVAANVRISIPRPTGISLSDFRVNSFHGIPCAGEEIIHCNLAELVPGFVPVLRIAFTALSEGTVTVTASITNSIVEIVPENNSASASAVVGPALPPVIADFSLAASASASSVPLGDEVRFTFTLTNLGPSTASSSPLITIPSTLTYDRHVLSSGGCSFNFPPDFICSFNNLSLNSSASVVIYTRPNSFGSITVSGLSRIVANQTDPNPDNNSASATITVPFPSPSLTSVSPNTANAGSGSLNLTLTGTNFFPNSLVRWNGADRPTTFISATELRAAIPASDISSAGSASLTVFTPAPGGGASTPLSFSVAGFTVSSTAVTSTVPAGQPAMYNLTITPQSGSFTATVTFSCAGLPQQAFCGFTPPEVTPGSGPAATSLRITTTARATLLPPAPNFPTPAPLAPVILLFTALLLLMTGMHRRARFSTRPALALASLLLLILFPAVLIGCGGGGGGAAPPPQPVSSGTPAGAYTVTVIATAGATQHISTVSLTVQ